MGNKSVWKRTLFSIKSDIQQVEGEKKCSVRTDRRQRLWSEPEVNEGQERGQRLKVLGLAQRCCPVLGNSRVLALLQGIWGLLVS